MACSCRPTSELSGRAQAQGQVHALGQQVHHLVAELEVQRQARVFAVQRWQQGQQQMLAIGHGGGQPHPAVGLAAPVARCFAGLVQQGQGFPGAHQKGLARLGQGQAPGGALEQTHAQGLLQPGHRTGHGRGHIALAGHRGKAALVDHVHKGLELLGVHAGVGLLRILQWFMAVWQVFLALQGGNTGFIGLMSSPTDRLEPLS
jgi:hypothetical protein